MIVFDLRFRPARFLFGHALLEELGPDVVLGLGALVGAEVGGGVEGTALESIVEPASLFGTGAEVGGGMEGAVLGSKEEPASLSEVGAVVLAVGSGFSACDFVGGSGTRSCLLHFDLFFLRQPTLVPSESGPPIKAVHKSIFQSGTPQASPTQLSKKSAASRPFSANVLAP